jgi:hypothetical protein
MKKSIAISLAGLLAAIVTIAAANIKLKKEYDLKNIKEYLAYKTLPVFHHIKDSYNLRQPWEWYVCNVKSAGKSGVGMSYDADGLLAFAVKNDTLFITKPENVSSNYIVFGIPVTIFCDDLRSISTKIANINIQATTADSVKVEALKKTEVKFQHLNAHYLEVTADNAASVSVSSTDTLASLALNLQSTSSFGANNVYIKNSHFLIGDSASLRLSGKSLDNIGIKRNQ